MTRRRWLAALMLALTGPALGEAPDQVLITYQSAGGRPASGVSRSMQWTATQLRDGTVRVVAQVPIDSFDSGNPEIDSLVRAALQSDRYPLVEVEGVAEAGAFEGTVALRGVRRSLATPISVLRSGAQLVVETSFAIDLQQFGIAIPSVDPLVTIAFFARLSADPAAVLAGGTLKSN